MSMSHFMTELSFFDDVTVSVPNWKHGNIKKSFLFDTKNAMLYAHKGGVSYDFG